MFVIDLPHGLAAAAKSGGSMDKSNLLSKLMDCPQRICDLHRAAQETINLIEQVQRELKESECHYLLDEYGPINGKNEQIREAQLYERTLPERIRLEELRRVLANREISLELAENEFQACLSASRLMAPDR